MREEQEPTAIIFRYPASSASILTSRAISSSPTFTRWRILQAVLQTHFQLLVTNWKPEETKVGTGRMSVVVEGNLCESLLLSNYAIRALLYGPSGGCNTRLSFRVRYFSFQSGLGCVPAGSLPPHLPCFFDMIYTFPVWTGWVYYRLRHWSAGLRYDAQTHITSGTFHHLFQSNNTHQVLCFVLNSKTVSPTCNFIVSANIIGPKKPPRVVTIGVLLFYHPGWFRAVG